MRRLRSLRGGEPERIGALDGAADPARGDHLEGPGLGRQRDMAAQAPGERAGSARWPLFPYKALSQHISRISIDRAIRRRRPASVGNDAPGTFYH